MAAMPEMEPFKLDHKPETGMSSSQLLGLKESTIEPWLELYSKSRPKPYIVQARLLSPVY